MGLKVTENTRRGGGSSSRSATGRKAKRSFIVEYDADTPPASIAVVETASDGTTAIPALNAGLPGDTDRVVTNVSVKPRGDTGLVFDVEVEYETPELGDFDSENPLTVPVDYDWDFSASSQPYFKDETPPGEDEPGHKLVLTSAGEPFENLLEREEGEISVTITDNIVPAAWNPLTAADYMFPATAKNDAPMTVDGTSIGTGQARFAGVRCSGIRTANGIDYRTRTIVLKLRENWDHVVADVGFNQLDPTDGTTLWEIVKGAPPVKVDKPWPLDGEGHAMPDAGDEPAELTFTPYPAKDFGIWGIT